MPYPIVNPLRSIHYTSKISVPSLYWCSGYELPVILSLDDIYCIDNEINCMFLVCLKFYIWYHDFISLKYFTLLRYFILLKYFSLLKFSDFTPLKYFSVLKYFFKMKYLYSVKYLMVLTYLHISFCPLTVEGKARTPKSRIAEPILISTEAWDSPTTWSARRMLILLLFVI